MPVGTIGSGSRLVTGSLHCQPPSRRSACEARGGSRWYTQPKGCIPDGAVAKVVFLSPADKYHRLTRRPSQGQKGLDEMAIMTFQWSSHPWGRPRSEPCRHTSPAQASSLDCFP